MTCLILASNANKDVYGEVNSANHFYTLLPEEISLDEDKDWGIALKEITFSSAIPTIINEGLQISMVAPPTTMIKNSDVVGSMMMMGKSSIFYSVKIKTDRFSKYIKYSLVVSKKKMGRVVKVYSGGVSGDKVLFLIDEDVIDRIVEIPVAKKKRSRKALPKIKGAVLHINKKKPMKLVLRSNKFLYSTYEYYDFPDIMLRKGFYDSKSEIVSELENLLVDYKITVAEGENDKLEFGNIPENMKIILTNGLEYILGFAKNIITKAKYAADYKIELKRAIFALFIYCSICSDIIVGDTRVSLLRTVHLPEESKHMHHHIVENPIYMRLNRKRIREIECLITDDTGVAIPWNETAKTILTLEIKAL